ncbi:MAG: DUF1735 domain-containing protein, partial [Sphingobacteriales bacterium]
MYNKKILGFALAMVALTAASCKKAVDIPGGPDSAYSMIYLPAAARTTNVYTLRMVDSVQVISLGAIYGGTGSAESDIKVDYSVDEAAVDTYNSVNGTTYTVLPLSAYELPAGAVIPSGQINSNLVDIKINPNNGMQLFKQYLLPVTISNVSGGKVNEKLRTAYYIVSASLNLSDFDEYSRDGWSILNYDSQEPAEGQPNGGRAIDAIDNNPVSFWHTKWDGGETPMPHWLSVDMGQTQTLHGITLIGRQSDNRGKPRDIVVSVSTNGTDWEDVGNIIAQDINDKQKYFVQTFREARYFRVTVTSGYGSTRYT